MLDKHELRELASYRDETNLICSFYYPLEKGEPTEQGSLIRLRNMINDAMANQGDWTSAQAKSVYDDLERVEGLVTEELVLTRGGLAVFACSAAGLWRVFHLPDKVGPLLAVDHSIRMRPLIELLTHYERYCTALVGKGRARIFLLDAAGVEERSDVFGEVPGRHDQGGWAQARYQRHHDDRVMRHLKDTAEETFSMLQQEEFDRLFVGGTEELVSEFVEHLHPYVRERFAGSFPAEMTSSPAEVQRLTMAEVSELLEAREGDVIEKLRAEVHSGNLGAAGLEDTIHALQKGQVMTLLVNEDFESSGLRCTSCGQLSLTSPCAFCGGETEVLPSMVEELVKQAFLQNCEMMFIGGDNREKLAELGGIGALLRFAG
ncbi:MAG TPA: Vms1/Ankzf1 family peptidyl-tRNA hydrolase [Anaerolineae bacterium]|nr:Vms1/Ankzf1 family peptidyl-tRNA hydrolase [Anaerolineae bacterium]